MLCVEPPPKIPIAVSSELSLKGTCKLKIIIGRPPSASPTVSRTGAQERISRLQNSSSKMPDVRMKGEITTLLHKHSPTSRPQPKKASRRSLRLLAVASFAPVTPNQLATKYINAPKQKGSTHTPKRGNRR